ncbi:phage tail protein [Bradyrhizobium iriomotense]|uniref:phage tail protein n=1 Tax=Bradyrhizobium iriomotense TaxID=441950 RepID=UPI001B8A570A|nr:tail fiber protein [Bradyrhizobium iriomotense]MBR0780465.1 tail fiber protein [Bradyrhizobium iriomotense]
MTLYKWSQTASVDATADSTINWTEGQSPSSVNDSARAMMAAIAKYRDDVTGAIVTTGTSTAYSVNTYQAFQTLAQLNGQVIAFTPHTTNGAGSPNVTLNVDGLGAKSIQSSPGVEIPAGTLIQGSPYVALYNASNGVFCLQNFFGNPYNIPIGASIDFWGSIAPNSSFALMYGQAISRTTYAALFSLLGTTYGAGDGSTTFNIPDLRGRVVAGRDDMGGPAASRLTSSYFGGIPSSLGAVGGLENHTLTSAQMPTHSHGVTDPGHTHTYTQSAAFGASGSGAGINGATTGGATGSSTTGITIQNAGSGGAHNNVQPTIIGNKLLRLI